MYLTVALQRPGGKRISAICYLRPEDASKTFLEIAHDVFSSEETALQPFQRWELRFTFPSSKWVITRQNELPKVYGIRTACLRCSCLFREEVDATRLLNLPALDYLNDRHSRRLPEPSQVLYSIRTDRSPEQQGPPSQQSNNVLFRLMSQAQVRSV
jgi:hypothetical protein